MVVSTSKFTRTCSKMNVLTSLWVHLEGYLRWPETRTCHWRMSDISSLMNVIRCSNLLVRVGYPEWCPLLSFYGLFCLMVFHGCLWNADMRRDVQEIFKMTPHDKQVMMFSATLSKAIRPVCKKFMQDVTSYGWFLLFEVFHYSRFLQTTPLWIHRCYILRSALCYVHRTPWEKIEMCSVLWAVSFDWRGISGRVSHVLGYIIFISFCFWVFFCGGFSSIGVWGRGFCLEAFGSLSFWLSHGFILVICAEIRWQFLAERSLPCFSSFLPKWSSFIGIRFDWLINRLLKDVRRGFGFSVT